MNKIENIWETECEANKNPKHSDILAMTCPEMDPNGPLMILCALIDSKREELFWYRKRLARHFGCFINPTRGYRVTSTSEFSEIAARAHLVEENLVALEQAFERMLGEKALEAFVTLYNENPVLSE